MYILVGGNLTNLYELSSIENINIKGCYRRELLQKTLIETDLFEISLCFLVTILTTIVLNFSHCVSLFCQSNDKQLYSKRYGAQKVKISHVLWTLPLYDTIITFFDNWSEKTSFEFRFEKICSVLAISYIDSPPKCDSVWIFVYFAAFQNTLF